MAVMRLDKFLANAGIGTRTQVKQYIKKSQVTVNGQCAKRPEEKIENEKDLVCFQGNPVAYAAYGYYMLHKPAGYLSATEDPKEPTVMELLRDLPAEGFFPVGRLDKDTEGLLLITNDGGLAHDLLSPKKHVDKTYYAKVAGRVTKEDVRLFEKGVDIGDEKHTMPAFLRVKSSGEISEVELTIQEGRFHQVKRMFEAVGKKVIYLKRISMGNLKLDENLEKGQVRLLTEEEVKELQKR